MNRVIYMDEYIRIFAQSRDIYAETFKKGFSLEKLNSIMAAHPEIGITSYIALRNAIQFAPSPPQKFGELKERIQIDIASNGLSATVTFNVPHEELAAQNREKLIRETLEKLREAGVVYGIKAEVLKGELMPGRPYEIAEGTPPVDGKDSVIRMYQLKDPTPTLREDGKVDFYELKLINMVKAGDWLGERIEATEGIPGRTVKGEEIKPVKGRNYPLNYDKNTVQEVFDNYKTTLYSRVNGAVNYDSGRISVSNHLEINGDVDLSTGNIKFDGYLTIRGTVLDGFSVEATKDIEINGDLGLGNIKGITSTGGSIYIKGGIASKNRAEIRAAKNIYIKFIDNAVVTCGGTLHIGYYCFNSIITAREVIVDSSSGQITGGQVKAEIRVVSPVIGSEIEKRTVIEVTGFNRNQLAESLDRIMNRINELKDEQQRLKSIVTQQDQASASGSHRMEYNAAFDKLLKVREEIRSLENERKNILTYLKTRGEGEICSTKKIYPNCSFIIAKNIIEIQSTMHAVSYYVQSGEIKQS